MMLLALDHQLSIKLHAKHAAKNHANKTTQHAATAYRGNKPAPRGLQEGKLLQHSPSC